MNRTIIYKTFLLVACMGCTGNLPENNEAETALQLSSVSIHEEGISKAIVAGTTVNTVNVYVAKTDNTVYDPTVPSLVLPINPVTGLLINRLLYWMVRLPKYMVYTPIIFP